MNASSFSAFDPAGHWAPGPDSPTFALGCSVREAMMLVGISLVLCPISETAPCSAAVSS